MGEGGRNIFSQHGLWVSRKGFWLVHMEQKPNRKSAMHRAATCACFCASHAYAMHASGRNNAAGFVLSKRIYRCVWHVRGELEGGRPGLSKNGYRTSGE